jgi:hypothetical protein
VNSTSLTASKLTGSTIHNGFNAISKHFTTKMVWESNHELPIVA